MTWRGSATVQDRIFGSLIYALPLGDAVLYGGSILGQFGLSSIFSFLAPLAALNSGLGGLILFFALFILVINNTNIAHFIRFNVFQALLLLIATTLYSLVFGVLFRMLNQVPDLSSFVTLLKQTLDNTVFLAVTAACFYSVFKSVTGKYADIPKLSDVVYQQVR
jgi:hypothetical protein